MALEKWNYKTHKYEPHEIPDEWNCKLSCKDLDETINCANCGKKGKIRRLLLIMRNT